MQFSKMHGLGNDFMVVDAVTQNVFFSPELIRRLADRHLGVGFDQLLVVEPPYDPELDFHYRIFNADGSEVAQCGNGARCFARFVRLKGLTNKRDIRVSTANGRMVLTVTDDDLVRVNMGEPNFEPSAVPFRANKAEKTYIMRAAEQTILCGVVSMGNPHCVIQVDDVDTAAICPNTLLRVCHRFAHDRIFNLLTDACLKICITGFDRHLYILSGSSTLQQYASL